MMNAIRSTIKNLQNWITDIMEATKEAFAEMEADKKNAFLNLAVLLRDYMNLRKAERSDWSRYGQQKGTMDDLKAVSQAMIYLKDHELFTLEDLDTALQGVNEKARTINADMKKASARMKIITGIQNAVADCQTHKAVHDKYLKIGWKVRQAAFAESHKDELDRFNKAFRYLKKQGVDLNVNLDALQTEYDTLKATHAELAGQLATVKEELQPMKDIRYWVGKVLTPEQVQVSYDSRQKPSVRPKIRESAPEQKYQQEEKHCYKVLADYFHLLQAWEKQYAPQQPEDAYHPLFVEALQRKSYIEYLLDILLYGSPEERKALVMEQKKEVMRIEQRIRNLSADNAQHHRGSAKQLRAEPER